MEHQRLPKIIIIYKSKGQTPKEERKTKKKREIRKMWSVPQKMGAIGWKADSLPNS